MKQDLNGSEKEYKCIKKALIALICVGDEINNIHRRSLRDGTFVISKFIVSEIGDNGFTISSWGYEIKCSFHAVEHYEGQLYVFEEPKLSCTRKARMNKIIRTIQRYG
jgi:hypothetical protein